MKHRHPGADSDQLSLFSQEREAADDRPGETLSIPDAAARRRALDPSQSFIVQAPAGAGKTELLTQRYLVLLASVERPEEILAITFTKKAAAEMRARVLDALARANDASPPEDEPHKRHTWELARQVHARDAARGWRIEENPGRLRIQTIDALCLGLTQQMPLLARFGAQPRIVEDATNLYREAAHATLALLDEQGPGANAVERLLRHLDNDQRRVAGLLVDMLARRDQWLRRVADRGDPRLRREALEAALVNVVQDELTMGSRMVPAVLAAEILHNARYAAANLRAAQIDSPILACLDITALPGATVDDLERWNGLVELLLTADGPLRAAGGLRVNVGFPGATAGRTATEKEINRQAKARMAELLAQLEKYPEFLAWLRGLRDLPPLRYDDTQWQVLQALVEALPLAAAQLKLVFAAHGRVDFSELAQGALAALGEPESPTDLLLALDYRLRHILVDEFQDTSVSQSELLIRLTAGWTPGDGRTLFLVGDPMQSIYRFREAEVGLYLEATHRGIGGLPLTTLTLTANFRSQAGVVQWVNQSFERIFPAHEDTTTGAVRYAPCAAIKPALPEASVTVHPFFADLLAEADRVVALVQAALVEAPEGRIAILVRNREHLTAIVPLLKRAGLSFRAIEIEQLAERQIVQDLLALTHALLHVGDRTAWLALLRAPCGGLTLTDLHALAADKPDATIWELMRDDQRVAALSDDGQRRLRRVRETLAGVIANRGRARLRRFIESAWLALGGPAGVDDAAGLVDAEAFFRLLDEVDAGGLDIGDLAARATRLYAAPDATADERLQIMTIHKAKGLEFDTVVVPGLGRPPRGESTRLLAWTERTRGDGPPDLLLAPVHATGADGDPISRYLRGLEQTRARHEELRLLYVAATRAKRRLHLLGHVPLRKGRQAPVPGKPAAGSLLAALWPVVEPMYRAAGEQTTAVAPVAASAVDWGSVQELRRLPVDWELPPPPAAVAVTLPAPLVSAESAIEFSWAGETARHVGTVVHRWLLRIGKDGVARWSGERVGEHGDVFRLALARLGVPAGELDAAARKVAVALSGALDDPRARWLLDAHPEAHAEYALSGVLDGRVTSVVLDRTFVDNDGVRWIVDYKTSEHEGADRDAFLDSEQQRYTAQLERYARLLSRMESRPVKLGLYFPLLRGWREWEFGKS